MSLYTIIFEFIGGTFCSQVEVGGIDQILDAWLDSLKETPIDDAEPSKSVMDYFNARITDNKSFDLHHALEPEGR